MPAVTGREKNTSAEAPAGATPELARLAVFAGHWHVEGEVYAHADQLKSHWTSDESCEWLPGRHFLVNRWNAKIRSRDFRGMAVYGHDPKEGYSAAFYDNAGNHPRYRVSIEGSRWTLTGEAQRAVFEFSRDSETMKIHWDLRQGGGDWQAMCDLSARRGISAPNAVRGCFDAYEAQDRAAIDRLFADDFTFTSPRDKPIDKAEWFKRCWPSKDRIRDFRIERLCEHGDDEAFVRYSAERVADGVRFRNTENFRVAGGRIRQIDVYFGRDLA
jgi:ketosteroid isomerase-like protein